MYAKLASEDVTQNKVFSACHIWTKHLAPCLKRKQNVYHRASHSNSAAALYEKAFLQLHLSVLLAGWTGIFGKLITMSPGFIVLWRIIIAGTLLWGWLALRRTIEYVRPKDRLGIMAVGALLMIQWTLFYAAIKASNVSITIVTFSSMGFLLPSSSRSLRVRA